MVNEKSLYAWCQQDLKNRAYLLSEWDNQKNSKLGLTPYNVYKGSKTSVYWICTNCGNSWQSKLYSRTNGTGCPVCARKFKAEICSTPEKYEDSFEYLYQELLKDWDYSKNDILPSNIKPHSSKLIWWKCNKCGNCWQTKLYNRTNGKGCPKCGKIKQGKSRSTPSNHELSLEYNYPHLMIEWDYKKNIIKPSEVKCGSAKKVWWLCKKGHSYSMSIKYKTTRDYGCPLCSNKSRTESLVVSILDELRIRYIKEWKQHINYSVRYYDFYLIDYNLVIEVDGLQHFKYLSPNNKFSVDTQVDDDKNSYLIDKNIPLLRLPGLDTYNFVRNNVNMQTITMYQFKDIVRKYIIDYIHTRKIPIDIIQDYANYSSTNYANIALKINQIK